MEIRLFQMKISWYIPRGHSQGRRHTASRARSALPILLLPTMSRLRTRSSGSTQMPIVCTLFPPGQKVDPKVHKSYNSLLFMFTRISFIMIKLQIWLDLGFINNILSSWPSSLTTFVWLICRSGVGALEKGNCPHFDLNMHMLFKYQKHVFFIVLINAPCCCNNSSCGWMHCE